MRVDVYIMHNFDYVMNIDIYPTPTEVNNVEGLCGNLNGDLYDDFVKRGGSKTADNDDFSLSWGYVKFITA